VEDGGKISYITLIDMLITDNNADPEFVDELEKRGIEVILV